MFTPVRIAVLSLLLIAGCASWTHVAELPRVLPQPRLAPRSVTLEITSVHVDAQDLKRLESLWQQVDEQVMEPALRRKLMANGFRSGVVGQQLPDELRELLGPSPTHEQATEATVELDLGQDPSTWSTNRRLPLRPGQRGEIVAAASKDELSVVYAEENRVRAQTYQQAQCTLATTIKPEGDGSITLTLTPEIQHGPLRQKLVGQDGSFRWEAGRDSEVLHDLRLQMVLRPGQTAMLGAVAMVGIARFFGPQQSP